MWKQVFIANDNVKATYHNTCGWWHAPCEEFWRDKLSITTVKYHGVRTWHNIKVNYISHWQSPLFYIQEYPQNWGWPDSPQLCDSLMISMKFNWHQNWLGWSESTSQGACLCIPPTTFVRHVVVLSHSPLPQCSRNVVEKLAREGRKDTSRKLITSSSMLKFS